MLDINDMKDNDYDVLQVTRLLFLCKRALNDDSSREADLLREVLTSAILDCKIAAQELNNVPSEEE